MNPRRHQSALKPRKPAFRRLKDVLWHSFSEADEKYLDLFRVGYALGIIAFLALQCYTVGWQGIPFDPVAFGGGFGAVLFGGGVGVGLRGRFEDGVSAPAMVPCDPIDGEVT